MGVSRFLLLVCVTILSLELYAQTSGESEMRAEPLPPALDEALHPKKEETPAPPQEIIPSAEPGEAQASPFTPPPDKPIEPSTDSPTDRSTDLPTEDAFGPTKLPEGKPSASPNTPEEPFSSSDLEGTHHWELMGGLSLEKFDYTENISGGASNESALVPMLWMRTAIPTSIYDRNIIFHADLELSYQTDSNYSGTTLNNNTAVQATDKNDFFNLRLTAEVPIIKNLSFDGGLGFRYWKRSITQGGGYDEYYSHQMLILGLRYYFPRRDQTSEEESASDCEISIVAHYDMMINPQMRVVFSDSVIGGQNSVFKLGARDGYDFGLEIKKKFREKWKWVVHPYFENFGYSASGQVYNGTPVRNGNTQAPLGNILEPSSNTQDFGIRLGTIYQF